MYFGSYFSYMGLINAIQFDPSKEVQTLAVGPTETNAIWYAGARLGVGITGVKIWAANLPPQGKWITLLTRVMEKKAVFVAAMLWDLLKHHIDLTGVVNVVIWSDSGTNFRCNRLIASCSMMIEAFKFFRMNLEFGPEHHFKSIVDGLFGHLTHAKNNAALTRMISDIDGLCDAYREDYTRRRLLDPSIAEEVYVNYMPPAKDTVKSCIFHKASIKSPIRQCYSYSLTRTDARRTSMFGRGENEFTLTGLLLRCHMLTGQHAALLRQSHPTLAAEDVSDDEREAADPRDDPPVPPEPMTHLTRDHQGWRTSYRQSEPERSTPDRFDKLLITKAKTLKVNLRSHDEPARHRSRAKIQEAAQQKRAKLSAKGKIISAALKRYRAQPLPPPADCADEA